MLVETDKMGQRWHAKTLRYLIMSDPDQIKMRSKAISFFDVRRSFQSLIVFYGRTQKFPNTVGIHIEKNGK